MNRTVLMAAGLVTLALVAGVSFYSGMLYGQSQVQAAAQTGTRFAGNQNAAPPGGFNPGSGGQTRGQGTGAPGGGIFGQISEVSNGVMVVTDQNGRQTRVKVTDTTLIEKNASVKLSDLTVGESVLVSGTTETDGTMTARSVQVAPAGRFGGPNGGAGR